jgi:N-acetylglutamate synthase-like GNAT family acetyltransferase
VIQLRPAQAEDQATIRAIIREARINPLGLDWRHFVVAEDAGQIVATGQIKPHADGSQELASIATRPAWQHQGLASAIVRHLLDGKQPPLYLMCAAHNEGFYPRFGFRRIPPQEMPPTFRRYHRMMNLFAGEHLRLVIMRWDGPSSIGQDVP